MRNLFLALCLSLAGLQPALADDPFVERNVVRWGGDYARVSASSAEACAQACSGDSGCAAWTFARPGTEEAGGVCHLKDTVPHLAYSNCCDSGVTVGTGEAARPAHARRETATDTASLY